MRPFLKEDLGTTVIDLVPEYSRSIPDPNFGKSFFVFLMQCKDMPDGFQDVSTASAQGLDRKVHKQLASSLLERDKTPNGTFHLKNTGIIIGAGFVQRKLGNKFGLHMVDGIHGILDGWHTYKLICENRDKIPADQFVLVKAFVIPSDNWIPMLSESLNSRVQYQRISLENFSGRLEWLKAALGSRKDKISWTESLVPGVLDARELLCILSLFNVILYPNEGGIHPIESYDAKAKILNLYEASQNDFEALAEISIQILDLHDFISVTGYKLWEDKVTPHDYDVNMSDKQKKISHILFYAKEDSKEYRIIGPILYPLLGAFRRFIKIGENGNMRWIIDFKDIKNFWESEGLGLLEICMSATAEFNYKPAVAGRSSTLWSNLHNKVGLKMHEVGILKPSAPTLGGNKKE